MAAFLSMALAAPASTVAPGQAFANDGGGLTPFETMTPAPARPRPVAKPRPAKAVPTRARPAAVPRSRPAAKTRNAQPAPRRLAIQTRAGETAPSGQPPQGETRFLADEVIVRYRLASRQSQRDALVRRIGLRHLEGRTFALAGVTVHRYAIASGAPVRSVIATLEASPAVVNAQPNYLYLAQQQSTAAPPIPQYAMDRLSIREAHEFSRGAGVTLAIVDSVVDVGHAEFGRARIESFDVRDDRGALADAHGTSIAGIIAAGNALAGVAPESRILAVAAFTPDGQGHVRANSWTVAAALDVAYEHEADILNLSFAGPVDPLIEHSLRGATRRGMIAVAASGNEGRDAAPLYPAAYPSVLAVTATDANDSLYAQASGGNHVAFAAPGVDIVTVAPGGAFGVASGTSLATAHVSGIAALLLAADPSMDLKRLTVVLENSVKDLGEPDRDPLYGIGLPNAAGALKAMAMH